MQGDDEEFKSKSEKNKTEVITRDMNINSKENEAIGEQKKPPIKDMAQSKEVVDLESVLRELNIFGRYHLKLMFLIGMVAFGSMWHSSNYVFAVENVGYRCKYPNYSYAELSKLESNSSFDYKCRKYELYDGNGACNEDNFNLSSGTECVEWVYDRPGSFVAEFNLACEDWKRTLIGTMHSVGYMVGLFFVGPLSDKFGRKAVLISTSVACAVVGLIKSFVFSYWLYVALETIEPLIGDCYSATFTLAIESVTKEHRPLMIFILSIFTAFGGIFFPIFAWLSLNWRIFVITIYGPGLIFILYTFWMDESLRWLLNKGKINEVNEIIKYAARTNKIEIDEGKLSNLKCDHDSSTVCFKTSVKMTFQSKRLLFRLLCCICMWFTALFNAYGLLINSVSLQGNKYLNFGLTIGLTGVVSSFVILYLLMKFKRKKPLMYSFLLTGIFCTAHSFLPTGYTWVSIMLYIVGVMSSNVSIRIVYIYTSELFPTYTRNTMHALCSALGRTAAVIAPQTPLLLQYWSGLPSLIMGILSLLTACLVMLLPDTSDEVLPDNVRQAEAVGKKREISGGMEKKDNFCSKL